MQRLESLGRLAGGVAHDFNNLLAVILTYTDLLARQLPDDDGPIHDDLDEIREAARRGADLTRRLLQLSRQLLPQTAADLAEIEAAGDEGAAR
jgi:signal transduction histidine kinase